MDYPIDTKAAAQLIEAAGRDKRSTEPPQNEPVCVRCGAVPANNCFPSDVRFERPYCVDCYCKLQGF